MQDNVQMTSLIWPDPWPPANGGYILGADLGSQGSTPCGWSRSAVWAVQPEALKKCSHDAVDSHECRPAVCFLTMASVAHVALTVLAAS